MGVLLACHLLQFSLLAAAAVITWSVAIVMPEFALCFTMLSNVHGLSLEHFTRMAQSVAQFGGLRYFLEWVHSYVLFDALLLVKILHIS